MSQISLIVPRTQSVRPITGTSPSTHREALAEGFRTHGVDVDFLPIGAKPQTKTVACWGWRYGKGLREQGYEVLVMERGYVGDRFKYTSLGWNGLNNHATFPEYPPDGGKRFFAQGGELKPWRKSGKYALILGQVRGDASLQGKDIAYWYGHMMRETKRAYPDMDIYFRPHPEAARRGGYRAVSSVPNMGGSLEDALRGARFTIAYNSNSCLDSILQGTPCFAGDKGTMAWDLCMKEIGKIEYPNRKEVAHRIAWTQWNIDEIRSGQALVPFADQIKAQ